jgi:hypothetical protein
MQTLGPDPRVTHVDPPMQVISGKVSTMYITDGTVNLLEGLQNKMIATGLGNAVAGMAGGVANAAMVAMYEGEYVQHFGCYIGEKMVIGTFPSVGFKEGEEVKAVVTRLDDKVSFAHAVVRMPDAKLWMPHSISKGRYAIAMWLAKLLGWISLIGWLFTTTIFYFEGPKGSLLENTFTLAGGFIGISIIGIFFITRSSPEGPYAERIFKVLGFKRPKSVNLAPYCERSLGMNYHQGGSLQVYDLRKALEGHNSLAKPAATPAAKR